MLAPTEGLPFVVFLSAIAWLVAAAVGAVEIRAGLARARSGWGLRLAGLFAAALALRLTLATWGPGDFFMKQGGAFSGAIDVFRGEAPDLLNTALFAVLPRSSDTIVGVSLLLGSVAPVLLTLFLAEIGRPRAHALTGGLLLAVTPVAVRFSGDASRQMHVAFLAVVALWALARYHRDRRVRLLVLSAASAFLAYRTRPEALPLVPALGLFALSAHLDAWRRLRERWFQLELVALGGLVLVVASVQAYLYAAEPAVSQHVGMALSGRIGALFTPSASLWLDPDFTSRVVIAATAGGAALACVRRDRRSVWAIPALVAASVIATVLPSGGLHLASARYQTLAVLFATLLATDGLAALGTFLLRHAPRVVAWAGVLSLGAAVTVDTLPPLRHVTAPRTIDLEYRFLHQELAALPEGSIVYAVMAPTQNILGGFMTGDELSGIVGRPDIEWRLWPPAAADAGRPAWYYRSAICSVAPWFVESYGPEAEASLRRCRDAEASPATRPYRVATVPAVRFASEDFPTPTVTIGLYEVRPSPPPRQSLTTHARPPVAAGQR